MLFTRALGYNIASFFIISFFYTLIAKFFLGWSIVRPDKKDYKKFFLITVFIIAESLAGAYIYCEGLLTRLYSMLNILLYYSTIMFEAFCMQLVFKKGWLRSWAAAVFFFMISSFSASFSFIFLPGYQFHIAVFHEFLLYILYNFMVVPLIMFVIILILGKTRAGRIIRHWIGSSNGGNMRKNILLSLYPVISETTGAIISGTLTINKDAAFVSITILVFSIIFVYIEISEIQKEKLEAQQISIQQQKIYIKNLEEMQLEMRRFRHDYKNMMSGMYLSAKEGDTKAVQAFIQDMASGFEHQAGSQIHKFTQLGNIHIMELKSLVLDKLDKMQQEHIKCDLEVLHPFLDTNFRGTDLCRCFGILIDNAMDEVRGKEKGYIHIMISSQEGCTTFRVKNILFSEVDFQKIWVEGYSTRGADRGTGLANYKKILERYENIFPHTSIQDGYFIQELKIQE